MITYYKHLNIRKVGKGFKIFNNNHPNSSLHSSKLFDDIDEAKRIIDNASYLRSMCG